MTKTHTYQLIIHPCDQTEMVDACDLNEIVPTRVETVDYERVIYHFDIDPENNDLDCILATIQHLKFLLNRLNDREVRYKVKMAREVLAFLTELQQQRKISLFDSQYDD